MRVFSPLAILISGLLLCAPSVLAQQSPSDVHVKLTVGDGKQTVRIGEGVKLVLEFTADRDDYQVDVVPERWQPTTDSISVSPSSGCTYWLDEYMGHRTWGRDVFSYQKLSNIPVKIEFMLNDTIRFDRPGKYSISVTTRRVSPASRTGDFRRPLVLTSNDVTLEILPMPAADEEKQVKRLADLLANAHGYQAEERIAQELSYLTGDVSTREKVKIFLNSQARSGNYSQDITYGLFIARNRALAIQLLEAAMRDPAVPVTHSLLGTLTSLRRLTEQVQQNNVPPVPIGVLSPQGEPEVERIQRSYLIELAAGLSKRSGKSQTTTAQTILMSLPRDTAANDPVLLEVKRLLVQQFDTLHPYDQEYLLRVYWDKLRDSSLIPSLQKMLSFSGMASKNIHDEALRRLLELAPDEARKYIIDEIRDPRSLVDFELLKSLPDSSVPDVDASLVEQLRTLTESRATANLVYLRHKTLLIARYATRNVYPDLMQIFQDKQTLLQLDARAALLAYFAKYNETEALPLIEQTLEKLERGQDFNFLPELTELYYSDAIEALLNKRVESDEPQVASTAAYLLSLHGSADERKIIERRLTRWRNDWSNRVNEADGNLQGIVERELIMALTRAKSWKLPPEQIEQLQRSCITKLCRQNFVR